MNVVNLIGRLTRDPEITTTQTGMSITKVSIAIDRPPKKDGTKEADFPRITIFGKQAENTAKFCRKGNMIGIVGKIQTGSYTNKNGEKIYTTDIIADRVEFLEGTQARPNYPPQPGSTPTVTNYSGGSGTPGGQVQMNPQAQYYNQQVQQISQTQGDRAAAQWAMDNGPWETIKDDDLPF